MEKFFDKISQWWVLITTSYIFFSLLSIYLHYSAFGINIVTYCDLSEIFTLSWAEAIITFFVIAPPFIFIVAIEAVDLNNRSYHWYHFVPRLVAIGAVVYFLLRYYFNINGLSYYNLEFIRHSSNFRIAILVGLFSIIPIWQTTTSFIIVYKKHRKDKINYQYSKRGAYFSVGVIIIFLFLLTSIELEFEEIDNNALEIVTFKSKVDSITSNNNIRFIGKTKNYILFFNKKERITAIYPMQDLIKLTFQETNLYSKKGSVVKPLIKPNPPILK